LVLAVLEPLLLIVQVQLTVEIVCFLQLLHSVAVMAVAGKMAVTVVVAVVLLIVLDRHILEQELLLKVMMAEATQLMVARIQHQVVAEQVR
jgi:hypothetical protein